MTRQDYERLVETGMTEPQARAISFIVHGMREKLLDEINTMTAKQEKDRKHQMTGMFIIGMAMVIVLAVGIALGKAFA